MQQTSFFLLVCSTTTKCRQPHFRAHLVSNYWHYFLSPGTNVFTSVTVYTLRRFRLVGSVAGSAPVLTTKQKTWAHTGTVPEFWVGCLNGCVNIVWASYRLQENQLNSSMVKVITVYLIIGHLQFTRCLYWSLAAVIGDCCGDNDDDDNDTHNSWRNMAVAYK